MNATYVFEGTIAIVSRQVTQDTLCPPAIAAREVEIVLSFIELSFASRQPFPIATTNILDCLFFCPRVFWIIFVMFTN
jgi:hypothetical protein